ncbi:MAG: threonine/serine exporter family protein [Lachnospiraceae bacterium]|nr:threonine/serine exporter family protein [Lachnospiraceae bacterium]
MLIDELEVGLVLEYIVNLAREMILAGANIERIETIATQTSECYGLRDVSIFLLNTHMIISAKSENGIYVSRQVTIPPGGIHLERLRDLDRLSRAVISDKPGTERLIPMLHETLEGRTYPDWMVLLGQMLATSSLSLLFGGTPIDAAAVAVITAALHYLLRAFARPGIAHIVSNAICMWVVTTLAILMSKAGVGDHPSVVIMSVILLVIPGIPLVNAMRNIFCNNEMNGILQLMKVVLETVSLVVGIYISSWMFGGII